jgi:hypothetical protein
MKANELLYWMSHLGEGTWESFKNAVAQLAQPDERREEVLDRLITRTRFRLSDIGSVTFSADQRRHWQVIDPVLASFTENPDRGVLCGGRSPALIQLLNSVAASEQCTIEIRPRPNLPDLIGVIGKPAALNRVAYACHVGRATDFAEEMIRKFVPISAQLNLAPSRELMIGWKRQYFDLNSKQWTANPIARTACECISQYGRRKTFLQVSKKKTVELPRREAIYAAASLARAPIVSYDSVSQDLRVPARAPLPEICARLACISSENVGDLSDGTVRYSPVPHRVARLILASLGQPAT